MSCEHGHLTLKAGDWICADCGESVDQTDEDRMADEAELTVDRSGRTLKDYRQLYWDMKKRVGELEAEFDRLLDAARQTARHDHGKAEMQVLINAVEFYDSQEAER